MRVLAFPIRLAPNGALATVEQGSDEDHRQQLAILLTTRPGELPSTPGYGTPDPMFGRVDPLQVASAAALFIPDIKVGGVAAEQVDVRTQYVTVNWADAGGGV